MPKIINKSKTALILGRFKVLPGQALPAMPYTVCEKKDIKHFIENGMLATADGKMPDFLMEKKDAVVVEQAVEVPVENPADTHLAEPVVEPIEKAEAGKESPRSGRRNKK